MPSAKRVLLVDGDAILRASLTEQLAREGHDGVIEAASLAEARAAFHGGPVAFVVVDETLPDGSGEDFIQELRKGGFAGAALLLSAEAGAGERLAKPFRFASLLARLDAHLSRHAAGDDAPIAIGPYAFRPGAKLLSQGARTVRLTEKETGILKFLHAAGATVPRETLLHEVWGYNPAVTTHTLETHIYRLRRKIEETPGEARILLTEEGGYRLARGVNDLV